MTTSAAPLPSIYKLVTGKLPFDLANATRKGVPAATFDRLVALLNMPKKDLAAHLGISLRTVDRQKQRHQSAARLSPEASARVVRAAQISAQARTLFTTDAAVAEWLKTPQAALRNCAPVTLLDTEFGAAEVENLLTGMVHGFFA